jgi:amidase
MEAIRWSAPAGACWLPATVVPVGLADDGLPVGIQIIGPYLGDRTTLEIAARLQELVGPLPRPAGF